MKKDFSYKSVKKWIILVSIVLVVMTFYVLRQLPDTLNVIMFTKGVIGVELLNKDFVELDEDIFFYKTGNVAPLIEHYEVKGYTFDEQFGAGYVFYQNDKLITFSSQTVTRWHSIMITQ